MSTSQAWLQLEPLSGATPDPFTITPHGFITDTVTTLNGTVTVSTTSPPGVSGSPKSITVHLTVIDSQVWRNYIPLLINKNP